MNFVTEVDIFCPIINYEMLFFSVSPNWQVLIFYLAESWIKLIDFMFFYPSINYIVLIFVNVASI